MFVTLLARSESNQLFDPTSTAAGESNAWCTSMVNTSAICIGEQRGMAVSLESVSVQGNSDEPADTGERLTVFLVTF